MAALPIPEIGFGQLRVVAPPRVRASDADRVATVQVLQDAMAEGRLTFDECAERMEQTYATRYVDDLPRLTADLPPPPAPPPAPAGWAQLARMALEQLRYDLRRRLGGRFTRERARRWRESVRARLGGGSGSRRGLRLAMVGLLVVAAVGGGLFLLALIGIGAHDVFDGGHGGGYHHHWHGYGHHHDWDHGSGYGDGDGWDHDWDHDYDDD
jgi:hypothetical protein